MKTMRLTRQRPKGYHYPARLKIRLSLSFRVSKDKCVRSSLEGEVPSQFPLLHKISNGFTGGDCLDVKGEGFGAGVDENSFIGKLIHRALSG